MYNNITIDIHGATASGKTTLALAFKEFLVSKGFNNVRVDDADVTDGSHRPEFQERRLVAVAQNSWVTIRTFQQRKA